jgi:hypothetical protein
MAPCDVRRGGCVQVSGWSDSCLRSRRPSSTPLSKRTR